MTQALIDTRLQVRIRQTLVPEEEGGPARTGTAQGDSLPEPGPLRLPDDPGCGVEIGPVRDITIERDGHRILRTFSLRLQLTALGRETDAFLGWAQEFFCYDRDQHGVDWESVGRMLARSLATSRGATPDGMAVDEVDIQDIHAEVMAWRNVPAPPPADPDALASLSLTFRIRGTQRFHCASADASDAVRGLQHLLIALDPEPPVPWWIYGVTVDGIEVDGKTLVRRFHAEARLEAQSARRILALLAFLEEQGFHNRLTGRTDWAGALNAMLAGTAAEPEGLAFDGEQLEMDWDEFSSGRLPALS